VAVYVQGGNPNLPSSVIQRFSLFRSALLGDNLILNSGNYVNTNAIGNEPLFLENCDFFCRNDDFVFTTAHRKLFKWGLNDSNEPVLLAQLQLWPETAIDNFYPGSAPVNVVGDYLYVDYRYIDTNLLNSIQDMDSPLGNPFKILSEENIAVAVYRTGLRIFNITNPLEPVQLTSLYNNITINDIALSGNILAVATDELGLFICNIGNPTSTEMLCYKPDLIGIKSLKLSANFLFISSSHELEVYDLSDPNNPEQTGYYSNSEKAFYDVQVHNNKAYVCQSFQLAVFDFSAAVSNPDIPELPHPTIQLSNHPNPFSSSTTITISGKTSPEPCELTIYNLKGQMVKRLHKGALMGENATLEWNCRDESNRAVAAGVYLYRYTQGNTIISKRLLMIK
jgi:hypothetical protein